MKKTEKAIRYTATALCGSFLLVSLGLMLARGQISDALLCLLSVVLLLAPAGFEKLLKCKFGLGVYLFFTIYAIGPILGSGYKLYYITDWWDKLLHISGGVAFALVGAAIFQKADGQRRNRILAAVFAFCFSVTLAAMWEFFEFGSDRLFGTDMQRDTVITAIHSRNLGAGLGDTGAIENITQVRVNGQSLPGYLDIGLMDTMLDMLLETLGALVGTVGYALDRKKRLLAFQEPEQAEIRQ